MGLPSSAKKRLPQSLIDLAPEGWLPLAAALFGTRKWQPQWMHHNFLPVLGLRLHSKVPPTPLTQDQLLLLCSLWHREGEQGRKCTALQQATPLIFGVPTPFKELIPGSVLCRTIQWTSLRMQNRRTLALMFLHCQHLGHKSRARTPARQSILPQ